LDQNMKHCSVCGGEVREGAIYRARDGGEGHVFTLPAVECVDCGTLSPDADRIDALPDAHVPSSVRIRCASIPRNPGPYPEAKANGSRN
jgi:hypothetical protein